MSFELLTKYKDYFEILKNTMIILKFLHNTWIIRVFPQNIKKLIHFFVSFYLIKYKGINV